MKFNREFIFKAFLASLVPLSNAIYYFFVRALRFLLVGEFDLEVIQYIFKEIPFLIFVSFIPYLLFGLLGYAWFHKKMNKVQHFIWPCLILNVAQNIVSSGQWTPQPLVYGFLGILQGILFYYILKPTKK